MAERKVCGEGGQCCASAQSAVDCKAQVGTTRGRLCLCETGVGEKRGSGIPARLRGVGRLGAGAFWLGPPGSGVTEATLSRKGLSERRKNAQGRQPDSEAGPAWCVKGLEPIGRPISYAAAPLTTNSYQAATRHVIVIIMYRKSAMKKKSPAWTQTSAAAGCRAPVCSPAARASASTAAPRYRSVSAVGTACKNSLRSASPMSSTPVCTMALCRLLTVMLLTSILVHSSSM